MPDMYHVNKQHKNNILPFIIYHLFLDAVQEGIPECKTVLPMLPPKMNRLEISAECNNNIYQLPVGVSIGIYNYHHLVES